MRYLDGPRPRLFAHRGASGLFPENTLESFRAALEAGAERLELDVHGTRDGHVVVLHDETLERTTNGEGPVRARSLVDVQSLDAGFRFADRDGAHPYRGRGVRVPTLDAVFHAFPGVPLNIEIKQLDPPLVDATLEVIDRHRARDRVLLAAEGDAVMAQIRAAAGDVLTGFTAGEVMEFMSRHADADYRPAGVALQVPPTFWEQPVVTADFVRAAQARGIEVHVWTLNDEPSLGAMLDLGVDGVMTDFPAMALAVLRRRGAR